ncbi:hypothetical protein [Elizabethkingia anophelis]|uniref:hypothetical protein n=1 Tax=Elizabethkingia anophelis TaxID=1117645 RepID=UPI0016236782|nr:hypothetical protein [Elizabethkingia anophelis]MCT4321800.1 hypothetical protein [Elizabethkingia anophelis]
MNSKELRIGNLIKDEHGTLSNIVEITDYDRIAVGNNRVVKDLSNCVPIPLTEEWLIKFGFKKGYNAYYSYLEIWDSLYIIVSKNNTIYISESSSISGHQLQVANFEHIHQIQNFYFAIANKELTLHTS